MIQEENKFGVGRLHEPAELKAPIYVRGCACMALQAEGLSYANAYPDLFTLDPESAASIVILACQVTDLAILNDLRQLESLMARYPGRDFYVGGCLARRFDVELPAGVNRLDAMRVDGQWLTRLDLIDYADPFWVRNFRQVGGPLEPGHLFRHMYPLRIGVGCAGRCKYCSIRITRGAHYELPAAGLEEEFLNHGNVLLVSDAPSVDQIMEWCAIAHDNEKQISIRNMEPQVFRQCYEALLSLASEGFLNILHVPTQSQHTEVLAAMGRDMEATAFFRSKVREFQRREVLVATNVIVDYMPGYIESIAQPYDHVAWNPYWDGRWNRTAAVRRWLHYLGELP